MRRRLLLRAAQAALLIAVAWGIYRVLAADLAELQWTDLAAWLPAPLPLAGSLIMLLAVYLMHALLWRRIMRDLAIGELPVRATVHVYFVASLGRYLPGKLWQLAGLAVLAKREGLPPASAAAAAVLGQFGFLTTGLLFLGVTLPEWRAALGADAAAATGTAAGSGRTLGPLALGAALLITGGAVLWLLVATPAGHGFRAWLLRLAGPRAGGKVAAAFRLADQVRPASAMRWALGYAVSWVLLGLAFALFVTAFEPAAILSTRYLAGTVAAAYLAGYIFLLAPAGIGVREAAMVLLLQPIMPTEGALVVSVLSRVWFTAAELLPLALLPVLPRPAAPPPGPGVDLEELR